VVGNFVGDGVGVVDGIRLGEGDGISEGLCEGVGVVGGNVGDVVGNFVGLHVVHVSWKSNCSTDVSPAYETLHPKCSLPNGGVLLDGPTFSAIAPSTAITQRSASGPQ